MLKIDSPINLIIHIQWDFFTYRWILENGSSFITYVYLIWMSHSPLILLRNHLHISKKRVQRKTCWITYHQNRNQRKTITMVSNFEKYHFIMYCFIYQILRCLQSIRNAKIGNETIDFLLTSIILDNDLYYFN